MRLPPNLKYFLFFFLCAGLIVLGVVYLPGLIPNIGPLLIGILLAGMAVLIFFTLFKPVVTFLYARADGIFNVYIDQSKKGFHVFAYHINNSSRYSSHTTRDIQHYYLPVSTGKIFYKRIFTHSMQPQSGRSGWVGFDSFETSVLNSPQLAKTLEKLSAKAGMQLQLGDEIKAGGNHHVVFDISEMKIELKKFNNATDEGINVSCTDKLTHTIAWQKKI